MNQVTEETLNMNHVFNNRALQIFQRKYHITNARRRQMGTLKYLKILKNFKELKC